MSQEQKVSLNERILEIIQDKVFSVTNMISGHSLRGEESASKELTKLFLSMQVDLLNELLAPTFERPTDKIKEQILSLSNQLKELK